MDPVKNNKTVSILSRQKAVSKARLRRIQGRNKESSSGTQVTALWYNVRTVYTVFYYFGDIRCVILQ